jgi:hypothetical protein
MEKKHGTFISSFPNHVVVQQILPKILHIMSPKFWETGFLLFWIKSNMGINKGSHFEDFYRLQTLNTTWRDLFNETK